MAPRLRHVAAVTTALTFVLILIGVYTGAAGAGLACGARWPLCGGFLGLFPESVPDFIEWSHRLVAMITGLFILGMTYLAWQRPDRRLRVASLVALVLTPVQMLLGANTIFNFGILSQVLHHGAALLIFGAVVVVATIAYVNDGAGGTPPGTGAQSGADASD